jgi:hypothetical protein
MKGGMLITQKIVPIFNPVSWQRKSFAARKYVKPAETKASLGARIALGETASQSFGKTGKVGGLPVVAASVKASLSGKSYGGDSIAQVREEKHRLAAGSIASMKAKLARL